MIRVILQGGLGNQMFEYATAYSIAQRLNQSLALDMSFFNTYGGREWCRPYELDKFRLNDTIRLVIGHKLEVKILPKIASWCRKHRVENIGKYVFLPKLSKRREQVLFGYFPNYHLFEPYRDKLLDDFAFKTKPNAVNLELLKDIETSESVSIHIRRGDYMNSVNARVFWHPTEEWYRKGMQEIEKYTAKPVYFFFSDDIHWAQSQFADVQNAVFVDVNRGKEAYNDMRLMAKCKHNIIANSTFSWWGAWLNSNPHKIVIAPEKYYIDKKANERYHHTMIPDTWKKID